MGKAPSWSAITTKLQVRGNSSFSSKKDRKYFTDGADKFVHDLSLKNAWLPPVFFLDFNNSC